jgi:hypothetical protein
MNNYEIELIENYSCDNENELKERERYWIDSIECINKNIPTRSHNEYIKIYNTQNKDRIKKRDKKYYENNKEKLLKQGRIRWNNWRKNNKDKIQQKNLRYSKLKYKCECGIEITRKGLARHLRSKKHNNLINK